MTDQPAASAAESPAAAASPRSAVLAASAEAAIDAAVAEGWGDRAPAVAIAVFDGTGVVAWRGSGDPQLRGGEPSRQTIFRIASMTKSFLAATALALVEAGALDLAAPIDRYVPGVRLVHGESEQRVSVGELLANRSGLPEDNAWGDRLLDADRERIAELFAAGVRLTAAPGERYQYSNLGMSLVGRAIEAVTGAAVERQIRERFLDPLGLTQTRFAVSEYPRDSDIAPGFRTFDDGASFGREPFLGPGALGCIGGMFSTVDDIARWARFLGSAFGAEPDRPDLLSPRSRREMQRVHTPIPVPLATAHRDLSGLGYGLGTFVADDRRFGRVVDHSGGLPGHSSHMRWHVESGIGVVAFASSDAQRCEPIAAAIHARVLADLGAPSSTVQPWPETLAAAARLDAILVAGEPLDSAADVLAANVLPDMPAGVRGHRFHTLAVEAGGLLRQPPLAERVLTAEDAAHLRWRIECVGGAIVCDVRLVGLDEPRVQSLRTVLAGPGGRKPVGEDPYPADWTTVTLPA